MTNRPGKPQRRTVRVPTQLFALLLGLMASLAVAVLYLALKATPSGGADANLVLSDEATRRRVVAELAGRSAGIWDSFADADVGRVLQVGLKDVVYKGAKVSSNAFGMRERPYQIPKPKGVLRVVILGDSYVFADGAEADDRMGVFLESFLRERRTRGGQRIEVLHLGCSSWNVVAECSYLRRQLGDLRPDLVVQILVANDVEDTNGVRGFGEQAFFTPRFRRRADGMVLTFHPKRAMGFKVNNHSRGGLDWESRWRFEDASRHLERLDLELGRAGAGYLVLVDMQEVQPVARRRLVHRLDPSRVAYLPRSFRRPEHTVAPRDGHWNRTGHEKVAMAIFGLLLERGLLPELALGEWEEASRLAAELDAAGRAEAEAEPPDLSSAIGPEIDFASLGARSAAQVHCGVDAEGRVSPYASMILRNDGGEWLAVEAECLPRPAIDGATVRVFADELELGAFELRAGEIRTLRWPLPPELSGRGFISARFEADDYVYASWSLQRCVAFRLRRVAVVGS